MANLPNLKPEDVAKLIPGVSNVEHVGKGGQKNVFRGTIEGQVYALKFAGVPAGSDDDTEDFATTDIAVRAKREVETMHDCDSPYMVKLGPVGLSFATIDSHQIVYFSEEFVVGRDLKMILKSDRSLPAQDVKKLGLQMTQAIKALWDLGKIHRDIKPANIMRRDGAGDFVLLDAGLAFDVDGESLSVGPVGTPAYFSPEQFDFGSRRSVLDFRSDIFSLGVTMYYMATGGHPFFSPGDRSQDIYNKITNVVPPSIADAVNDFPKKLDDVILRMMGKSPHLRFRKCDQLIDALKEC